MLVILFYKPISLVPIAPESVKEYSFTLLDGGNEGKDSINFYIDNGDLKTIT